MMKLGSDDAKQARTTSVPSKTQVSASIKLIVNTAQAGSNGTILTLHGAAAADCWTFYYHTDHTIDLYCATNLASTFKIETIAEGIPFILGFTYDGTTGKIYINGVLDASGAVTASGNTPTTLVIGDYAGTAIAPRISIENIKIWSGASGILTADEMLAEAWSDEPVKTLGLWASYQDLTDALAVDTSSNGRNFETTAGTITDDVTVVLPAIGGNGGSGGISAID